MSIQKILEKLVDNSEVEMLKSDLYRHMKKFKKFNDLPLDRQGEVIIKLAKLMK